MVVAGALGYGSGIAIFNMAAGLFLKPMQQDLGWSAKELTLVPIVGIVMALCSPFTGVMVDRWNARRVLIGGLLLYTCCLIALSVAPATHASLYGLAILTGIIAPATSSVPITKAIATWFRRSAGTAFGVTLNGNAVIAILALPLISAAIFNFGWRYGFAVMAGLVIVLGVVPSLLWFREKESAEPTEKATATLEDTSLPTALKQPVFWLLLLAFVVAAFPLGGFMSQLAPIVTQGGLGIAQVTLLTMTYAGAVSVGRIGGGVLLDKFWDGAVAASLLSLSGLGAFMLAMTDPATMPGLAFIAVFLLGIGHGAEVDFTAYFTLKLFGVRRYSTLMGIYSMFLALSMSAGALAFAAVSDEYNDYGPAIWTGGICYIASGVLILFIRLAHRRSICDEGSL